MDKNTLKHSFECVFYAQGVVRRFTARAARVPRGEQGKSSLLDYCDLGKGRQIEKAFSTRYAPSFK